MEDQFLVVYKQGLKSGIAKYKDGKVILSIPQGMKNNGDFHQKMYALGRKLWQRIQQKTFQEVFSPEGVLLFGERVGYDQLPKWKTDLEWGKFFVQELFAYADPILQDIAGKLGFGQVPLRVRKVSSKRGSCTFDNRIMLNVSLVFLPTRLIQYVIVHEACHLMHKHHRQEFWDLVARFSPHYAKLRKELNDQVFLSSCFCK